MGATTGLRYDLWAPVSMQPAVMNSPSILNSRGQRWLDAFARLKPGVTQAQAEQDLTAIAAQLSQELRVNSAPRAMLMPLWKDGGGRVLEPVMLLLRAVVGVVLLTACANISNLLLARAAGRRRDVAIRLAVGASRGRLVRMPLVESLLISVIGGTAALAMAPLTNKLLQLFIPVTDLPISLTPHTDFSVFAYGMLISAVAAALCGLAPALRSMRSRILQGRDFSAADDDGAPKVIVVNQTFAKRYLKGNALERQVNMNRKSYSVVVVVADAKFQALNEPDARWNRWFMTWTPGYRSMARGCWKNPSAHRGSAENGRIAAGLVRRGGAAAGGGGHVRDAGVHRIATDAGAGHSHGAGGKPQ